MIEVTAKTKTGEILELGIFECEEELDIFLDNNLNLVESFESFRVEPV